MIRFQVTDILHNNVASDQEEWLAEEFNMRSVKMEAEIKEVETEIEDAIKRATSKQHIEEWEAMLAEVKQVETEYKEFEETGARMIAAVKQRNTSLIHEIDKKLFEDEEKVRKACSTLVVEVKRETITEAETAHAGVNSDVAMIIIICLLGIIGSIGLSVALSSSIVASLKQINTAVSQLDSVTQSSAANAEESSSVSEELAGQAQNLNAMIEQLAAIVGSSSTSGRGLPGQSVRNQTGRYGQSSNAVSYERRQIAAKKQTAAHGITVTPTQQISFNDDDHDLKQF